MDLDKFAGGDQGYLRDVQYGDPGRLTARAGLHVKYSTSEEAWFPWVVGQVDWVGPSVLDPEDVLSFITSNSPGEEATPQQVSHLRDLIGQRISDGGGVFRVSKETGLFLNRGPKR